MSTLECNQASHFFTLQLLKNSLDGFLAVGQLNSESTFNRRFDMHVMTCNLRLTQETFVSEVEILRNEMESSEVVVEGEFASESQMEEWNFSEHLVL